MNRHDKIVSFLKLKPGYLKKSSKYIAELLRVSEKDVKNALKSFRNKKEEFLRRSCFLCNHFARFSWSIEEFG